MKKKFLSLTISLLTCTASMHSTTVFATESIKDNTKKVTTDLPNLMHSTVKVPAKEEQPFWSTEQTRQAELEKQYKKEIAENPDNKYTYTYLAGLYLTNNKTTQAIDAYQDAITHNPENPKLFAAISIAYLHQSKFSMARAMADEALRLDPSLTQVKKINEYIVAKEKSIQAAANIPLSEAQMIGSSMGSSLGTAPADATQGVKGNKLMVDNPQPWVKTQH